MGRQTACRTGKVVDMGRDIPPEWLRVLNRARYTTARRYAESSSIGKDTIYRAIFGGPVSDRTLRTMAKELKVDISVIERLRDEVIYDEFPLPAGAERLTRNQRETLNAVVRAMLEEALPRKSQPARLRSVARKTKTPREGDSPP